MGVRASLQAQLSRAIRCHAVPPEVSGLGAHIDGVASHARCGAADEPRLRNIAIRQWHVQPEPATVSERHGQYGYRRHLKRPSVVDRDQRVARPDVLFTTAINHAGCRPRSRRLAVGTSHV